MMVTEDVWNVMIVTPTLRATELGASNTDD